MKIIAPILLACIVFGLLCSTVIDLKLRVESLERRTGAQEALLTKLLKPLAATGSASNMRTSTGSFAPCGSAGNGGEK